MQKILNKHITHTTYFFNSSLDRFSCLSVDVDAELCNGIVVVATTTVAVLKKFLRFVVTSGVMSSFFFLLKSDTSEDRIRQFKHEVFGPTIGTNASVYKAVAIKPIMMIAMLVIIRRGLWATNATDSRGEKPLLNLDIQRFYFRFISTYYISIQLCFESV